MSKESLTTFFHGVRSELPILVGTAPFGLIYGVSAVSLGVPPVLAQAMSAIVFAGSAQFVMAQLIAGGIPSPLVALTATVINLRHLLYSASIAPFVQRVPLRWRLLLAYLLVDEVYAVSITHFRREEDPSRNHWFLLGAGLALWTTWQVSTAIGVFLGARVPSSWSLDFTLALTFIALVVPALTDRPSIAAALVAGITAVLASPLPLKTGLLVAAFAGLIAGLVVESFSPRKLRVAEGSGE
jgi:4-azaleucine resistance transporter AzlC